MKRKSIVVLILVSILLGLLISFGFQRGDHYPGRVNSVGPAVIIRRGDRSRAADIDCAAVDYAGVQVDTRGFPFISYVYTYDSLGCILPKNQINIYPLAIVLNLVTVGLLVAATQVMYKKLIKKGK